MVCKVLRWCCLFCNFDPLIQEAAEEATNDTQKFFDLPGNGSGT